MAACGWGGSRLNDVELSSKREKACPTSKSFCFFYSEQPACCLQPAAPPHRPLLLFEPSCSRQPPRSKQAARPCLRPAKYRLRPRCYRPSAQGTPPPPSP